MTTTDDAALRKTSSNNILANGTLPESSPVSQSSDKELTVAEDSSVCPTCSTLNCPRHVESDQSSKLDKILWPKIIDEVVQDFVEKLLKNYVFNWYSEIGTDECFIQELRIGFRRFAVFLVSKIKSISFSDLLLHKIVPACVEHLDIYMAAKRQFPDLSDSDLEERVFEMLNEHVHEAALSRDSEIQYLRNVAEVLMDLALHDGRADDSKVSTSLSNIFLREILCINVFLQLSDLLADPDIVNKLLILLLDPEPSLIYSDPPSERVAVLKKLAPSMSPAPYGTDSLLQIKLLDIIENRELLYYFMNYIREIPIAIRYLSFVKDAHELQKSVNSSCVDFAEDPEKLREKAEEIFRHYFREDGRDLIRFPGDITQQYTTALEMTTSKESISVIESALNRAYRFVFERLQTEYVTAFCQSQVFFQMLAGDRKLPDITVSSASDNQEGWLVFSKFKTKLASIFSGSVEEGAVPAHRTSFLEVGDEVILEGDEDEDDFGALIRFDRNNLGDDSLSSTRFDRSDESSSVDMCSNPELTSSTEDAVQLCNSSVPSRPIISVCPPPAIDFYGPSTDLSAFSVSIPRIEPRRDPKTQRTMYVYIVETKHNPIPGINVCPTNAGDFSNGSPAPMPPDVWTVDRRYREFYVLESKLNEFHGNSIAFPPLPPKKSFGTKGRAFVESVRPHFDEFLKTLLQENDLKCSELLFLFLTSQEEFTSSFLSDLNPLRAIKAVPSRMQRERGQNLTSFLETFVASVETFRFAGAMVESRSNLNEAAEEEIVHSGGPVISESRIRDLIFASQFSDNAGMGTLLSPVDEFVQLRQTTPASLQKPFDLILFILMRIYQIPHWLFTILCTIRMFAKETFDHWLYGYTSQQLSVRLHERRLAELISELSDLIFDEKSSIPRSPEQRELRRLLAERMVETSGRIFMPLIVEVIMFGPSGWGAGSKVWFECLQLPRLNKQLFYRLSDCVLREIMLNK